MSDGVVEIAPKRDRDASRDWPEEAKQAAWELFAGPANRSLKTVESLLASSEYGYPVPLRVLYQWRDRYHWDIQLDKLSRDIAPTSIGRAVLIAATKAPAAMSYLAQVAEGIVPADKGRVHACIAILDRVGIGPIRQVNTLQLPAITGDGETITDIRNLSDAELAKMIREHHR